MAYTKTVWVDGSDPFTPASPGDPKINAANLNKIEDELEYLDGAVVSTTVKNALIGLFEKCAYIDTDASIASNIAILEAWAAEVTSLTLSASNLTFSGSGTQTLTATVDPVGSTVVWTSSDQSVATVSGGVVTAVGNGSCTITASAGNLNATCSVTVSGLVTMYNVTNNLTLATNSNAATSVAENSSYTATLAAESGYILSTVSVTMGGVDITAAAYSSGTVTIADVTGDIVITATAVEWEVVATLESADFSRASLQKTSPYYASSTIRVAYTAFDIPVEYGYIYKFAYTTTASSTQIGIQFHNQNALDAVAGGTTIADADVLDPGWKSNGVEYTVPQYINSSDIRGVRPIFHRTNNASITTDQFTGLTISRKVVS